MNLHLFALDYRRLAPAIRDRVALPEAEAGVMLGRLQDALARAGAPLDEAALLVTCHRCELYAVTRSPEATAAHARAMCGRDADGLHSTRHAEGLSSTRHAEDLPWTHLRDAVAARHLCRVACGLDSSLTGEPQVLGQVRRAWETAAVAGASGPVLGRMFRVAVSAGKRARRIPGLLAEKGSLAELAVRLAADALGGLQGRCVAIIGAGQTAALVTQALLRAEAGQVTVVARRPERAPSVGAHVGARPFARLAETLAEAEAVISATSAPGVVVDVDTARAAALGRDAPLVLVDLAVPRDIAPEVRALPGVVLIDADEIAAAAGHAGKPTEEIASRLERLAGEAAAAFVRWASARPTIPAVVRLRRHAERIQRREVARALRRLPGLSDREQRVVTAMAEGIINRLLHAPTVRLKAEAAAGDGAELRRAVDALFSLDTEEPSPLNKEDS